MSTTPEETIENDVENKEDKMTSKQSRNVMWTQQIDRLPELNLPDDQELLFHFFEEIFQPDMIACIKHQKDVGENGELVAPHYHFVMSFLVPQRITTLAKKINDRHQSFSFRPDDGSEDDSARISKVSFFSYLCHRSAKSAWKFQYDPHSVRANFNYPEFLEKNSKGIGKVRKYQIEHLLNAYGEEKISLKQLKDELTPLEYAKNKSNIKGIQELIFDRHYENFKKEMTESGEQVKTYFLFGQTGSGKTRFAKEKFAGDYYITGSKRDPWANYGMDGNFPSTVVLDEIRSDTMSWTELLQLVDPFNNEYTGGSRYFDKKICSKNRVITGPLSPIEFYNSVMRDVKDVQVIETTNGHPTDVYTKENPDRSDQFFRRITVFRFELDYIIPMYYNPKTEEFEDLIENKIKNRWSTEERFKTKDEILQLTNELFGSQDE